METYYCLNCNRFFINVLNPGRRVKVCPFCGSNMIQKLRNSVRRRWL